MLKRWIVLCSLIMLILAGCGQGTSASQDKSLELKVRMTMKEPGVISVSAGLHNAGMYAYQGTDSYNGFLTILDGAGKLRALGEVNSFEQLASDETFYPITQNLNLAPGVYQLKYSALDKTPIEMQFEVVLEGGNLILKAPQEFIDPFTEYTSTLTS